MLLEGASSLPQRAFLAAAAELPRELARYAVRPADLGPDAFGVDEFVGRVAERADLPHPVALRLARMVVSELASATSPDRLAALCGTLPGEWRTLLDERVLVTDDTRATRR